MKRKASGEPEVLNEQSNKLSALFLKEIKRYEPPRGIQIFSDRLSSQDKKNFAMNIHLDNIFELLSAGLDVNAYYDLGYNAKYTPLQLAIMIEYEELIQMLLKAGADPNQEDPRGRKDTPLHLAVHKRNWFIVDMLLEAGADPNKPDVYGMVPLNFALRGDIGLAERLLKGGADPKVKSKYGGKNLIMQELVESWNLNDKQKMDNIELLLDHGLDINDIDDYNSTCLLYFFRRGISPLLLRFLIKNGANVNIVSKENETALNLSLKKICDESIEILSILLEAGADHRLGDNPLLTLVKQRTYNNDDEYEYVKMSMIQTLIEAGVDLYAKDEYENTLLHLICMKSAWNQILEILLKKMATQLHSKSLKKDSDTSRTKKAYNRFINAQNKNGDTPILYCIKNAVVGWVGWIQVNLEGVKLLLDFGADPNIPNSDGNICLHLTQNKDTIEIILPKTNDINTKNNQGYTPLLKNINNREIVEILIKNGANINAVNNEGSNGLHLLLSENVIDVTMPIDYITFLINSGVDIHARTNDRLSSPLHTFIENFANELYQISRWEEGPEGLPDIEIDDDGFLNVVRLFIESKFDLNLPNQDLETILVILVKNITLSGETFGAAIKMLLDAGANPDMRDKNGDTALHIALSTERGAWGNDDSPEIARLLIDHGASFIIKNNDGKTPFDLYIERTKDDKWPKGDEQGIRRMIGRLALSKEFEEPLPETGTRKLPKDIVASIIKHIEGGGKDDPLDVSTEEMSSSSDDEGDRTPTLPRTPILSRTPTLPSFDEDEYSRTPTLPSTPTLPLPEEESTPPLPPLRSIETAHQPSFSQSLPNELSFSLDLSEIDKEFDEEDRTPRLPSLDLSEETTPPLPRKRSITPPIPDPDDLIDKYSKLDKDFPRKRSVTPLLPFSPQPQLKSRKSKSVKKMEPKLKKVKKRVHFEDEIIEIPESPPLLRKKAKVVVKKEKKEKVPKKKEKSVRDIDMDFIQDFEEYVKEIPRDEYMYDFHYFIMDMVPEAREAIGSDIMRRVLDIKPLEYWVGQLVKLGYVPKMMYDKAAKKNKAELIDIIIKFTKSKKFQRKDEIEKLTKEFNRMKKPELLDYLVDTAQLVQEKPKDFGVKKLSSSVKLEVDRVLPRLKKGELLTESEALSLKNDTLKHLIDIFTKDVFTGTGMRKDQLVKILKSKGYIQRSKETYERYEKHKKEVEEKGSKRVLPLWMFDK